MAVGIAGVDSQGLLALGNRLVHLSLLEKRIAEVVVGVGIVGVDFQGLYAG